MRSPACRCQALCVAPGSDKGTIPDAPRDCMLLVVVKRCVAQISPAQGAGAATSSRTMGERARGGVLHEALFSVSGRLARRFTAHLNAAWGTRAAELGSPTEGAAIPRPTRAICGGAVRIWPPGQTWVATQGNLTAGDRTRCLRSLGRRLKSGGVRTVRPPAPPSGCARHSIRPNRAYEPLAGTRLSGPTLSNPEVLPHRAQRSPASRPWAINALAKVTPPRSAR